MYWNNVPENAKESERVHLVFLCEKLQKGMGDIRRRLQNPGVESQTDTIE
jgi:hypothetical protein